MADNKVLVIIINYNQSEMTIDCVQSVLKSDYENYEILLIDNGSTRQDFNYLKKHLNKKVLLERLESNCGYVGGVNHGLRKGSIMQPDYFLIMNNDTIVDKFAISFLFDCAVRYDNEVIVTGKVYDYDVKNKLQTTGSIFTDKRFLKEFFPGRGEIDHGQFDEEEFREMLDDIFWLLPYSVFKKTGYYSDNFFLYGEQADYALRAVREGVKLVFTPKAKIWHKGSLTTGNGNRFSPVANFWRKKGSVIYLYRNTKKRFFVLIIFKALSFLIIKNCLNFLKLRNNGNQKSEYAALLGYVYAIKWIFDKKPDNGYNPFLT